MATQLLEKTSTGEIKDKPELLIFLHDHADYFLMKHRGLFKFNLEEKIYREMSIFLENKQCSNVIKLDCNKLFREVENKFKGLFDIELFAIKVSTRYRVIVSYDFDRLFNEYHLNIYDICQAGQYLKSARYIFNEIVNGKEKEIIWQSKD